jgi:hypothetical protein
LVVITPTTDLLHACFSVSAAVQDWQSKPDFNLIETETLGFVSIQEVDMDEG